MCPSGTQGSLDPERAHRIRARRTMRRNAREVADDEVRVLPPDLFLAMPHRARVPLETTTGRSLSASLTSSAFVPPAAAVAAS